MPGGQEQWRGVREKSHCSQESRNPLELGVSVGANFRASGEVAPGGGMGIAMPSYLKSLLDREGTIVSMEC